MWIFIRRRQSTSVYPSCRRRPALEVAFLCYDMTVHSRAWLLLWKRGLFSVNQHFWRIPNFGLVSSLCMMFSSLTNLLTSPQVPKTTQCSDSHPCADPALLSGPDGNSRRPGITGSAEAHLSGDAGDGAVPPQHIPEMSQPSRSHASPEDPLPSSRCLRSPAPLPCPQQTQPSQAVWGHPGGSMLCSHCRKTLLGPTEGIYF